MKRFDTRSHFDPTTALVCLTLAFVVGPGCVMTGTHDQVVAERDALGVAKRDLVEQIRLLRIANESLDENLAGLFEEREELLEAREALTTELALARAENEMLVGRLERREDQLAETVAALALQNEQVDGLQATYEGLLGDLEEEVADGQVQISQLRDGLQVGVSEAILFASGSAELSEKGVEVLGSVTQRLVDSSYSISVEGHTDSQTIRASLQKHYPSNWELAGARAASVVRLFAEAGVNGVRLTAVSRGSTDPIGDNSTAAGRARNRRIEIRLRPMLEEGPIDATEAGAGSGS